MRTQFVFSVKLKHDRRIHSNLHIKYVRIIDEDDNGIQYKKTVRYMENTLTTSKKLAALQVDAPKYVRNVINYIINHLTYNVTVLELKNGEISKECNIFPADVTKAIKYLKDNDVIRKIRELDEYKDDNMFTQYEYFINPEYIYCGSINNLTKE